MMSDHPVISALLRHLVLPGMVGINLCAGQIYAGDFSLPDAVRLNRFDVNDLDTVRNDINSVDVDGATALHWAVHRDRMDIVQSLIAAGADVNRSNAYGITPLWLACRNTNTEMIDALLSAGADANASLPGGETVLMQCVRTGTEQGVKSLIEQGADVNRSEYDKGQTALMWAAASGRAGLVERLIESGARVTEKSKNGFTPLMFSARSGDIDTAKRLLGAGSDPDEATATHGNAMLVAAAGGHDDLAVFLIDAGANVNSEDEHGVTALHHAVRGGLSLLAGVIYDPAYRVRPRSSLKLATRLIEAGAEVNKQIASSRMLGPDGTPFSMQGATPYLLAAAETNTEMMDLLKSHGADPRIATVEKISPLMAAAQSACTGTCAFQEGGNVASPKDIGKALEVVRKLVEEGADITTRDIRGRTVMHIAAFTGADPVVQYLADRGADVNAGNIYNETPWTMASGMSPSLENRGLYGKHDSTSALLIKLGAKPVEFSELIDPYSPTAPVPR